MDVHHAAVDVHAASLKAKKKTFRMILDSYLCKKLFENR